MSQIKSGALLSYLTTFVSLLLGLLYTPWMISVIGRDDYGLYTLAITLISIFMMDFGLGTGVSRYLSVYYAKGEIDKASKFLGMIYKLYLALAALVCVVLFALYFCLDQIYVALSASQLSVFKQLYVVVAFYSIVSVPFLAQNNILIANERFVALRLYSLLQKLAIVLLTIVALICGMGVLALVAVNALCNLAFIAIKAVFIRRRTKSQASFGPVDIDLVTQFAGFSGWVTLSQICQRCNYNLVPSVLGIVSKAGEIAIFGLASQLESYVYALGDALGGLFMPRVARILEQETSAEELTKLMVRVGRLQIYVVGLVFVGFVAYGASFVDLWLGEGFEDVWIGTLLLIGPSMLSLPQQIGTVALTVSNKVKYQAYANAVMAASCIGLSFPLAKAYGGIGACAAIMVGLILNRILNNVYYAKHLRIDVGRFFRESYPRWMICSLVLATAALLVQRAIPCDGWMVLVLEVIAFSLMYALVCWLICFNSYEKGLVYSLLGKALEKVRR